MDKLTAAFDIIFHWAGVWAVMVFGTVAAHRAYGAVRRRITLRRIERTTAKLIAAPQSKEADAEGGGGNQAQKAAKDNKS